MPIRSFRPLFRVVAVCVLVVAGTSWWFLRSRERGIPEAARAGEAVGGPGTFTGGPVADGLPAPDDEPKTVPDVWRDAVVRDEREIADAHGTIVERWRLIELKDDPGRLARVVDYVKPKRVADTAVVRQEVMAPDSVLVGVPAGTSPGQVAGRLRAAGFATRPVHGGDAVVVVQLPAATLDAVPETLDRLAAALPDLSTEPNFLYFPFQATPSDYDAAVMWGLENIEAPAAWTVSTGITSVVVAVIDTGIDLRHPDLASNIWRNPGETAGNGLDDDNSGFVDDVSGWNFAEGDANPADADDHGTHVSGTIGAIGSNGVGVTGVNWSVQMIPMRAGNRTFESGSTLNALHYVNTLKQLGVNIVAVNASFGGGSFSAFFRDELIRARDNGVLFIAAAGNDGASNDISPLYPAGYEVANVIAVAALHPGNERSSFSNFGAASVDLAAPGTAIRSTIRNGGYDFFSGTSQAAPHVTGAAALVAAANPSLAWDGIRDRILNSVDPVPALAGVVATGGKLNVRRAVSPSLVPPRITITVPAVDLVAMDRPGVPLALSASLAVENGVTAAATILWEMIEGPAPAAFSEPDQSSTTVFFSKAGRYWLRVVATSGVFTRNDDLIVVVGIEGIAEPVNGLVASWSFNETGSTARDESGAGRNGTILGGPARVAGIDRGGVSFDGANGRISFAAPTLPALSIAGWINPAPSGGVSIFPRMVHMQSGLLFLGRDASDDPDDGNFNTLKFARDTGSDRRVWFAPPGTAGGGGWSHVAVAFNGSAGEDATPHLYFEGEPRVAGVQPSGDSTPSVPQGIGYIGDRGDGGRVWNGLLDEVRIYDRELTRPEVAVLARLPLLREAMLGRVDALLSTGSLTVPVSFLAPDGSTSSLAISQPVWSALEAGVSSVVNGTAAQVVFPGAGSYTLRLDMVVGGAAHVVRTLPVTLNTSTVATVGTYTGRTSEGGVFALQVDPSGKGTLVGGAAGGLSQDSFQVSTFGTFSFAARDGTFVTGQIAADGPVAGTMASGATFVGGQSALPSANRVVDGTYDGWVLRGSVRARAIVADGIVTMAIEENGPGRSASGSLDGSGEFTISAQNGSLFAGTVEGGRMDVTVVDPETGGRDIVLLRSDRAANARLVNLSVRGQAGAGEDSLIAGFVVRGAEPLPVLVRGVGPGLAGFGVSGVLRLPQLVLQRGAAVVAQNAGWDAGADAIALAAVAVRTGAFPLAAGSSDAAVLAAVTDGTYTTLINSVDGTTGNVLGELFDAREETSGTTLVNLSARARVRQGDAVTIGGFVIEGRDPALLMVRAAGPALSALGVSDFLPLTELVVRQGNTEIARSESWGEGAAVRVVGQASNLVGAFSFAERSADAALLLYLPAGAYTAQVSGREGQTGVALVEVYLVEGG